MDDALISREKVAVDMRLSGASLSEIAERLGYSDTRPVYRLLSQAIAESQPDLAEISHMRQLEVARYDKLLATWWPKALGWEEVLEDGSKKTHPPEKHAAEFVLKVMRDKSKLLGLAHAPDDAKTLSISDLDAMIAEAEKQLNSPMGKDIIEGEIVDDK